MKKYMITLLDNGSKFDLYQNDDSLEVFKDKEFFVSILKGFYDDCSTYEESLKYIYSAKKEADEREKKEREEFDKLNPELSDAELKEMKQSEVEFAAQIEADINEVEEIAEDFTSKFNSELNLEIRDSEIREYYYFEDKDLSIERDKNQILSLIENSQSESEFYNKLSELV